MMDYGDTTVMIPVKDEPATESVVKAVFAALPNCKIIVVYKGNLNLSLKHKNLKIVKQTGSGKGRAVIEAGKFVDTEILCLIDGDNTYEVNALRRVIALVRYGADMALA